MCFRKVSICLGPQGDQYLIECEHLSGHLSPVVQCYPHPVVDLAVGEQKYDWAEGPSADSVDLGGTYEILLHSNISTYILQLEFEKVECGLTIFPCLFAMMA